MPRPKCPSPSYLLHKPTGQARVRLKTNGRFRDVYLGEYGSPESLEKYHRLLAEHHGGNGNGHVLQQPASAPSDAADDWTVAELVVKYDDFARTHYVKNGEPTDDRYRAAIGPLVRLYGRTLAREFGPKKLQALREFIIRRGSVRSAEFDNLGNLTKPGEPLGRGYVNNLMKSVVRMFKWAVTEEMIPPSVPDALSKVGGLRKGRDRRVREPEPIRPVPDEHFRSVVEASSPQIAAMLQIQKLAGMRPEVCLQLPSERALESRRVRKSSKTVRPSSDFSDVANIDRVFETVWPCRKTVAMGNLTSVDKRSLACRGISECHLPNHYWEQPLLDP